MSKKSLQSKSGPQLIAVRHDVVLAKDVIIRFEDCVPEPSKHIPFAKLLLANLKAVIERGDRTSLASGPSGRVPLETIAHEESFPPGLNDVQRAFIAFSAQKILQSAAGKADAIKVHVEQYHGDVPKYDFYVYYTYQIPEGAKAPQVEIVLVYPVTV